MEQNNKPAPAAELDTLKALAGAATPIETDLYGDRYMQGPYSRADLTAAQDAFVTAATPSAILRIAALVAQQAARIAELESALLTVEKWSLPATGKTWPNGTPMSYASCYGSGGERDYMRRVAHDAVFGSKTATQEGK